MNTILVQLLPYAAGLLPAAVLTFFVVRLHLRLAGLLGDNSTRNLNIDVGNVKMTLAELASRLSVVERDVTAPPAAPRGNINLSKRGQVIRLHRRGDAATEIASAVGLRRGEVELIIKLQRMNAAPKEQAVAV